MKIYLIVFLSTILVAGCSTQQLMFINSAGPAVKKDSAFRFENDTLIVAYQFWGNGGEIAFAVYNKLSVPIYIDWKKCSYVVNKNKLDYWADGTIVHGTFTTVSGSARSYLWNTPLFLSLGVNASSITRPERITFVAPRSAVVRTSGKLWSAAPYRFDPTTQETSFDKPTYAPIKAKVKDFPAGSSPLVFRNFITYSTSETFSKEYYVDNEFFVNRIVEYKSGDEKGRDVYGNAVEEPLKGYDRFFISGPPREQ